VHGLALPLLWTLSCTPHRGAPAPVPSVVPASAAPAAPAPASGAASTSPSADEAIAFIEDDYAGALAQARARHVPLFIDAWATWCHTCLSMRSYVFPDAALKPIARRFVWLALDTEREGNAPVVERLGAKVLPTFYVLDPDTEAPRLAHPGSLTAPELVALLAPFDGGGEAAPDASSPVALAARVYHLDETKDLAACVREGVAMAPGMPPGTPRADVLRAALECAADLREGDAAGDAARARLPALVDLAERVVSDPADPILADDRSDLYDYVIDALKRLGRTSEAGRLASAWAAFLEDRAARAPSASARAVFDAHRLLAYEAIGEPARAIPMLEASARDFPDDYNPPARLGRAYFDLKRYDDAIAAIDRAIGLAYGPRKLRLWALEADVEEAKGDPVGARRALTSAVNFAKTIPLTGGYPRLADALAERLARTPARARQ
jgi:tetratricopeptide (TPR) repeat protein